MEGATTTACRPVHPTRATTTPATKTGAPASRPKPTKATRVPTASVLITTARPTMATSRRLLQLRLPTRTVPVRTVPFRPRAVAPRRPGATLVASLAILRPTPKATSTTSLAVTGLVRTTQTFPPVTTEARLPRTTRPLQATGPTSATARTRQARRPEATTVALTDCKKLNVRSAQSECDTLPTERMPTLSGARYPKLVSCSSTGAWEKRKVENPLSCTNL